MKFKKIIVCSLLAAMTFSLIGCGQKETKKDAKDTKQKVVIGTSASYKPWAFQENDKLKGFEIDIWREIAKRENLNLEFKLGQFSGLVGMLDAGEIDSVAHQMSITPKRKEKYEFSTPYAYSYYDFFVKKDSPIKKLDDLKGKKVGCWLGGNGERTLRDINKKYNLNLNIVTFDGAPMEKEVLMGRIDALWQGEVKTKTIIKENKLDLVQLNQKLVYEVNAYPFKKDEKGKKLSELATKAIDSMRKDGTLKKLSEKWFEIDVTEPQKDSKQ